MAKKSVTPIMTWIFWGIVVLGAFLAVTWEYFVAGFSADSSKITWIIMIFFVLGLWFSLRAALHLDKEFRSLRAMDADQRIGDANASDIAALFDAAVERVRRGDRIDSRNLVAAYGTRIKAQVDNISVLASMLITIGLLGTVVGLIITVTGLDAVLQSNSADFASMKAGLNRTVSGMGTAFYTTFFGALLGGVVLKVLGAEMKKAVSILVADALRFSELYIAPLFAKKSSETLIELESRINGLHGQLGTLGDSFGAVIETLDSKQVALASGLGQLVEVVESTNQQANERAQALISVVDGKIDETNRLADERLQAITAFLAQSNEESGIRVKSLADAINQTVEETNRLAEERIGVLKESVSQSDEQAGERTNALVHAVGSTIEETNRLADERLRIIADTIEQASRSAEDRLLAMMERIGLVVDETHNKANERLAVLSDAVSRTSEETHRLADERLQSLVKAVETAAHQTHQKSEEHLVGFINTVDKTIEKSRKDAENSLDAKASDLASKLNQAATLLSSLGSPPNPVDAVESEPGKGE